MRPVRKRGGFSSERDIILKIGAGRRGVLAAGRLMPLGFGHLIVALEAIIGAATGTTTAPGIQHLHFGGHDFRGVAIRATLILPLAGAQGAFDIDLAAFLQILTGNLRQAIEKHHPVPFGACCC